MRDLARKITKHCFYDESDNPRLDGIEKLLKGWFDGKDVFVVEKCGARQDPFICLATFSEVYAIEEMLRMNKERPESDKCFYRVTPVPFKEPK